MRIGLVGTGRWGRNVLRDLRSLGCEVHAVARSAESVARAGEGGAASVVARVDALPDVAGIVVCTATSAHAEAVGQALAHGVPVFCEKPLTCDPEAADRLAAEAPERLFVMDKWRYHTGVAALAGIASSGELGPPVGLRLTRRSWGQTHDDVDAVWVLAPHDLAIALEILGEVPPLVAARGFDAGVNAGVVALLGERPWVALDSGASSADFVRRVELHLEGGVAWLAGGYESEIGIARAEVVGQPDSWERRPIEERMPLRDELAAFLEHLRGGPPPRSSAAEGALIVRRVAEIRAAAGLA